MLVNLQSAEVRTYISEKQENRKRHWEGKAEQQQANYANRRRAQGSYGQRLLLKLGQLIEMGFAQAHDTGRRRRTHLPKQANVVQMRCDHERAAN